MKKRSLLSVLLALSLFISALSSCALPPSSQDAYSSPSHAYPSSQDPTPPSLSLVEQLASDTVTQLGLLDLSQEEAIRVVYDYLVETVFFDDPVGLDSWRYLSEDTETPISYLENRSLSPLLFEIGSCEDFAAVLVSLLRAIGLDAHYVAGYTLSVDQVFIDHAWTVVLWEGDWYHLDPQLEQNIVIDSLRYRFFMKTDAEMEPDHRWGENLIELWPHLSAQEQDTIRTEYLVPECDTLYPTPPSRPISLPPRPDALAVDRQIQAIKEKNGKNLEPIYLNIDPPILSEQYHITPLLLPDYYSKNSTPSSTLSRYGRQFLSSEEQKVYDYLVDYLSDRPLEGETLLLPTVLLADDARRVLNALFDDYATFYWAEFTPLVPEDYSHLQFSYMGTVTAEDILSHTAQLEERAAKILRQVSGDSEFELALLIHDVISKTVVYRPGTYLDHCGNAYGALVEYSAYCNGYARAFQYLADTAGLRNIYIRGWDQRGTTHAWNAVELDGNWYYVDTTWDRISTGYGGSYHDFFATTLEESLRERVWDESQYPSLPESFSRDNDFYIQKEYAIYLDSPVTVHEDIYLLADMFARQLTENQTIKNKFQYAFLEIKLIGSPADYDTWRKDYPKEVFKVLRATQERVDALNLPFEISYDTTVSCHFNDSMQVLAFYPLVKLKE